MPQPRRGEGKGPFIERCIPVVIEHGTAKDEKQAYAICNSVWNEMHDDQVEKKMADYFIEEHSIKAATESEVAAQKKRAAKYGISPKKQGNVTKPSKYSDVPEGSFGDPVNYKYPADAAHARPALTYFNQSEHRTQGGYSSGEWAKIGKRLAKLISRHLDGTYEYRGGKLQKKESKMTDVSHIISELTELLENAGFNVTPLADDEGDTPAHGDDFSPKALGAAIAVTDVGSDTNTTDSTAVTVTPAEAQTAPCPAKAQAAPCPGDTLSDPAPNVTMNITIVAQEEKEPEVKDGINLDELKSVDLTRAIKLLDETPEYFLVGGYGNVWGNRHLKDLEGEYFTPDTDFWPDLVPVKLVFYEHTLAATPDKRRFDFPIGKSFEEAAKLDDVGKWIQAQIDKRAKWVDAVMQLVDRGILAWSSGAVPHLIKRARDGWLERWPTVEYTMTPTPAEPRNTDIARLKTAYEAAGLKWFPDNIEPDHLGTESDDELVARLAVERERARLLALFK